jgi:hypothetical protein
MIMRKNYFHYARLLILLIGFVSLPCAASMNSVDIRFGYPSVLGFSYQREMKLGSLNFAPFAEYSDWRNSYTDKSGPWPGIPNVYLSTEVYSILNACVGGRIYFNEGGEGLYWGVAFEFTFKDFLIILETETGGYVRGGRNSSVDSANGEALYALGIPLTMGYKIRFKWFYLGGDVGISPLLYRSSSNDIFMTLDRDGIEFHYTGDSHDRVQIKGAIYLGVSL